MFLKFDQCASKRCKIADVQRLLTTKNYQHCRQR